MNRTPYCFGSELVDTMLSQHTGSEPAIIYQESIMSLFGIIGFEPSKSYKVLKAISKKKLDVIMAVKDEFLEKLTKQIVEQDKLSKKDALAISKKLWTSIESSASYAFNSPHSLATALDSLYLAYLKTVYPSQTYSVLLDYYLTGKKRNLKKTAIIKKELESIGYSILDVKIGQDNTEFFLNPKDKTVVQSIMSIKSMNEILAKNLKEIPQLKITHSLEMYHYIKQEKNPDTNRAYNNKRHFTNLCKIKYFNGNNKKQEILIPILYDKIFIKKQFRPDSWRKLLSDLSIPYFDLKPYCSKISPTGKTYYLDDNKKIQLCDRIINAITQPDYTIEEEVLNLIDLFGYLPNPEKYIEHKIYTATVKALSYKNKSIMIETFTGNEIWVFVKEDPKTFKRGSELVILKATPKKTKNKESILLEKYITL